MIYYSLLQLTSLSWSIVFMRSRFREYLVGDLEGRRGGWAMPRVAGVLCPAGLIGDTDELRGDEPSEHKHHNAVKSYYKRRYIKKTDNNGDVDDDES